MFRRFRPTALAFACLVLAPISLVAQLPSIADKTKGLEKKDGFFPVYWDASSGKLWLEVPAGRVGQEFLYITGAPTGLGSNDIGLDRGQIGGERIVKLVRVGPKL